MDHPGHSTDHVVSKQAAASYALKHADHESLHTFLFVFLFVFLIGSQIGLYWWKKKYYRSFQNVTLIGLWVIPFILSMLMGYVGSLYCIYICFANSTFRLSISNILTDFTE